MSVDTRPQTTNTRPGHREAHAHAAEVSRSATP